MRPGDARAEAGGIPDGPWCVLGQPGGEGSWASRTFYEALGFEAFHGDAAQGWLILKNGDHVIGLFQGMFERNILTFNPGWDASAQPVD